MGDRFKSYEAVWRQQLPANSYVIVRVDGNAFHSYLRGAEKPYDLNFMHDMDQVAADLCRRMQCTVFAYQQSDEISFLLTDFETPGKQMWFGGSATKIISISAAFATSFLGSIRPSTHPIFDSRVFVLPNAIEVANYFVWRQRDAIRNSIAMAAQAKFSPRELHGKNTDQMQEMLFQQHSINWSEYPEGCKRGRITIRKQVQIGVDGIDATRTIWATEPAPHFKSEPDTWLAYNIPAMPNFES